MPASVTSLMASLAPNEPMKPSTTPAMSMTVTVLSSHSGISGSTLRTSTLSPPMPTVGHPFLMAAPQVILSSTREAFFELMKTVFEPAATRGSSAWREHLTAASTRAAWSSAPPMNVSAEPCSMSPVTEPPRCSPRNPPMPKPRLVAVQASATAVQTVSTAASRRPPVAMVPMMRIAAKMPTASPMARPASAPRSALVWKMGSSMRAALGLSAMAVPSGYVVERKTRVARMPARVRSACACSATGATAVSERNLLRAGKMTRCW